MKKFVLAAIVAATTTTTVPAQAADACQVVLCMYGMVQGQNVSQCSGAIASYFAIVATRHGHPDLSGTTNSRLSFTQGCTSAPAGFISAISQTFGNVIK